ncbi:hypothetical protein [Pseudovibrio sp. Ad26]|uniref:hypothetical protein n=1 Tax=Pseudovibrio sp. Ad26 TaxID=989410 RepID=UPI0007B2E2D4|nr:hypothetical protein [Pseudovibrio sp. Ad26]KZL05189.1 hypothetical protein PsAD26_04628 [Pseudovibrio sp. Ad26]
MSRNENRISTTVEIKENKISKEKNSVATPLNFEDLRLVYGGSEESSGEVSEQC